MLYTWIGNVRQSDALQPRAWPNMPPLAPDFAIRASAFGWVSHMMLYMWPSPPQSASSEQYVWTQRVLSSRSGEEGHCEASEVAAAPVDNKLAMVALRSLTLDACLFLAHTWGIWRQALEFPVERLRILPVPQKEVRFLHRDGGDRGGEGGQKENESMETHRVTNS
jgi:hypothetical protein